jgi:hypothetical protein
MHINWVIEPISLTERTTNFLSAASTPANDAPLPHNIRNCVEALHCRCWCLTERIPPNRFSRIEPLNLVVKWPIVAILRNRLWYNGLRIFRFGRFMGRCHDSENASSTLFLLSNAA